MTSRDKLVAEYKETKEYINNTRDYLNVVIDVYKRVYGEKYIIQSDNNTYDINNKLDKDARFIEARKAFEMIDKLQIKYKDYINNLQELENQLEEIY